MPSDKKSYTESNQKHTDCGYAYKLDCCYDNKYSKPLEIYSGKNALYHFMEEMLNVVRYCDEIKRKNFNKDSRMTKKDTIDFQEAERRHICNKKYTEKTLK